MAVWHFVFVVQAGNVSLRQLDARVEIKLQAPSFSWQRE